MTRIDKLYKRLLASPGSISFREFQRVLEAFGFTLDRINGSHHIYRHHSATRPLSIQPKGKFAKPYQIDQFIDIIEEFGLKIVE